MLTTSDYGAFMLALDPGDVLAFSGKDAPDRLLQFLDNSHYNHVGVWLGDFYDPKTKQRISQSQTIHAGLSFRNLDPDVRAELLADPAVRRNGTVSLLPLDAMLGRREDEVGGGGLTYHEVTALRWDRIAQPLDVAGMLAWMLSRLEDDPPLLFDYDQLAALGHFWIDRAYGDDPANDEVPATMHTLFDQMSGTLSATADLVRAARVGDPPLADREKTTCGRFVFDAFVEGLSGNDDAPDDPFDIASNLSQEIKDKAPADASSVRDWITPNDVLRSPSFRVIARYTKRPRVRRNLGA